MGRHTPAANWRRTVQKLPAWGPAAGAQSAQDSPFTFTRTPDETAQLGMRSFSVISAELS